MRTLFVNPPYGRYDMGRFVFPAPHPTLSVKLAQAPRAEAFAIQDYLNRLGLDPSDIDRIADTETRDELKAKFEECRSETDTTKQLTCFAGLAARVYSILDEERRRPEAGPPAPPPPKPENGFPIVPVAIGAVAAAGLIYFIVSRG